MSERADNITSYTVEKKTALDYLLLVGGWMVSCVSLVIIGLIVYWAIKIPEKNVNNLPIINAIKGSIRVEPVNPGEKPLAIIIGVSVAVFVWLLLIGGYVFWTRSVAAAQKKLIKAKINLRLILLTLK